ncbi:MAG: response regulator [Pseudomonadota bacterium]|nr:response regulator [Pseudomonadota bacterium]
MVFMDIQMPVVDGFEAARRIRCPSSLVRDRKIPIVATTAHVQEGYRQRCLDIGMHDYIPKPVNPDAMYAKIAQWAMDA